MKRLSLANLLADCELVAPIRCSATESGTVGFTAYGPDAADGIAREPDSLYLEAVRP
jgi:hypothetical protein